MNNIYQNFFNKDNVFVINLDKRKDRLKLCTDTLNSINIQFTRFSAIVPNMNTIKDDSIWNNSYQKMNYDKCRKYKGYLKGSLGCKMSHYNVIKLAKDKQLPYVVVFEDDIILSDNSDSILKDVYSFINDSTKSDSSYSSESSLHKDWDILYLGGKITGKNRKLFNKYKEIKSVKSVIQMLGYILNSKSYDLIMNALITKGQECDNIVEQMGKNKKINVYYTNLVKQTWNDSNIITRYI